MGLKLNKFLHVAKLKTHKLLKFLIVFALEILMENATYICTYMLTLELVSTWYNFKVIFVSLHFRVMS